MSFLGACALSHLIQVVVSQTVLSQSPLSQTVPMGSLVKLNCHTERLVASLVLWYRQQQWRDMQLVYKVGQYLPADGRFSGEIDDKSGNYSLVISNVQRNDSGMYYCATRNSQSMAQIFGNGSKLVVTAGPPAVFLLTPPPDEIPSIERVPLICLVRGLSPHSFPIRWNVSGRVIEGQTDSGTIDEDGTYSVRSHISVPVESWSSGVVCTCTVQINSTENPISESVSSQRGSPLHTSCDLPIYLSSLAAAALLLLGMVVFTAGRSCRKRQSGNMNSDEELPNSRPRVQEKETLYARLAFNENPKL
ncbi:immunoglobulin kappa light chain-like isoform X1 [Heterodontus francisci]|uniref:immunoglobulin kappa light chain-like isoform X1 n=1 Tax=Heterodontus francisci TaxID=7792 RepID=UPI00355BD46F